jgi:hypothetical protein
MFTRIVSGGQTGVDRAALDVSLELGIPCGGWCPRGRKAEDGPIAARYPLQETPTAEYAQRTEWNVRDSDGTLVLTRGEPGGGTALTITLARRLDMPYFVLDLEALPQIDKIRAWARRHQVLVLNVAGPRESDNPGIYEQAAELLRQVLAPS